jgi:hypothetical protein
MGGQERGAAIVWVVKEMFIQNVITDFTVLSVPIILSQLGLLIDSKNLFIGQYDKLFEEYWLSPISYLSPYRG